MPCQRARQAAALEEAMSRAALANAPVGSPYVARVPVSRSANVHQEEANAEQLSRILTFNAFTVKVLRVRPLSKRVLLSGRDAARAMKTLARNGWTALDATPK